jgi:hypothetical protein
MIVESSVREFELRHDVLRLRGQLHIVEQWGSRLLSGKQRGIGADVIEFA